MQSVQFTDTEKCMERDAPPLSMGRPLSKCRLLVWKTQNWQSRDGCRQAAAVTWDHSHLEMKLWLGISLQSRESGPDGMAIPRLCGGNELRTELSWLEGGRNRGQASHRLSTAI